MNLTRTQHCGGLGPRYRPNILLFSPARLGNPGEWAEESNVVMASFPYFDTPFLWEKIYEAAITEPNPQRRLGLLREAQQAVLQRAQALDEQEGHASFEEATALEEAADFLKDLKLATESDGVGKQIAPGDREQYPRQ